MVPIHYRIKLVLLYFQTVLINHFIMTIYKKAAFLLLVLMISLPSNFCFAQNNSEQVLSSELKNFRIKVPSDYSQTQSNIYLKRTKDPNEHVGLLLKVFENSDKNIALGFVGVNIIYASSRSVLDSMRVNNYHLATITNEADESKFKIERLSKKYSNKVNVDEAFIYQLKLDNAFLDRYNKCKVVLLHKKNIADAQMYFFYNNINGKTIEKFIKKNTATLSFDK